METDRKKLARKYRKQTLWYTAGLTLITLLLLRIYYEEHWITPVCISAAYTLTTSWGLSYWREHFEAHHPHHFVMTSMMGITIRLVTAGCVTAAALLLLRHTPERAYGFVVVFAAYYLASIFFDAFFFTVHKEKH